jgi:CcmD family protein
MDRFPYLFAAYTVVWVVLFAYVWSVDRRARRAERELEEVRKALERERSPTPAVPPGTRS